MCSDQHFDATEDEMDVATTTVVTTTFDNHSNPGSCPSSPEPKRPRISFNDMPADSTNGGLFHMADSTVSATNSRPHLSQTPTGTHTVPFPSERL